MTVVVTGAAGFIGFHVCRALLQRGERVVGIDNLNDYYDVRLKEARLRQIADEPGFTLHRLDVADRLAINDLFGHVQDLTGVVHLAAQAGVRYSLENPYAYADSNILGQIVVIEAARRVPTLQHLVYASSSSVYGGNTKLPFSTDDPVDQPVSIYAASKRAAELISHAYSHLYGMAMTGLRFFTVYGPWGRPDMAAYLFAEAIVNGRPLRVFNHGNMRRDFTYIDDIVAGVLAALDRPPAPRHDGPPHVVYNLGNHRSESLLDFIATLEQALGRSAEKTLEPMQPGDVPATYADIEASRRDLGFSPSTPIAIGIPRFVEWYQAYRSGAFG